jgi:hypothetical protein
MFQPVIPLSGNSGWAFLERTYDRQLENYSKSPQIRNDRDYMLEKLAHPITLDEFLSDRRLLRVTMTAYGLAGEEWKGGFIRKAIEAAGDPESTFLVRLNNTKYTQFAQAFAPIAGKIIMSSSELSNIAANFEAESFESAVGEVDDSMRLALNYKSEIPKLIGEGSSEKAMLYRILGDVPASTVLESALNIPKSVKSLPVERQAELLKERIVSVLGISDVSELSSQEMVDTVIRRFHAMESIKNVDYSYTPASAALTLLSNGVGSQASQNLFLSLIR